MKTVTATFILSNDETEDVELELRDNGLIEDGGWYDIFANDSEADDAAREMLDRMIAKANERIADGVVCQSASGEWSLQIATEDKTYRENSSEWSISGTIEIWEDGEDDR